MNTAANPLERGKIAMFYGTGEGQTTPGGVSGLPTTTAFPKPLLPASVTISGNSAEVLYAGVIQINARVPADIAAGIVEPVGGHDLVKLHAVRISVRVELINDGLRDGRRFEAVAGNGAALVMDDSLFDDRHPHLAGSRDSEAAINKLPMVTGRDLLQTRTAVPRRANQDHHQRPRTHKADGGPANGHDVRLGGGVDRSQQKGGAHAVGA